MNFAKKKENAALTRLGVLLVLKKGATNTKLATRARISRKYSNSYMEKE